MKKFVSGIIIFIIIVLAAIPACATETIRITLDHQDNITGKTTVSIMSSSGTQIQLFKTINGKKEEVTSYISDGTVYSHVLTFDNLQCGSTSSVTVYAETDTGEISNVLLIGAHGPHNIQDWTTIKPASCTETGESVRYCVNCGEIVESKTIPASSHLWSEPIWNWTKDYSECTATFTCKRNMEHSYSIKDSNTKIVKNIAPTCIENGSKAYSASVEFGGRIYTTTKTVTLNKISHTVSDWIVTSEANCTNPGLRVKKCTTCNNIILTETIPASGHDYQIAYNWAKDFSSCTATAICKHNPEHTLTETAKGVDNITRKATCLVSGKLVRTVNFSNSVFTTQTKEATITGSHVDADKNNICDVCKMNLSALITANTDVQDGTQNEVTSAPTEITTSYNFDNTTQSTTKSKDVEVRVEHTPYKLVITISVTVFVLALTAVVLCIISLKKENYKKNKRTKKSNEE